MIRVIVFLLVVVAAAMGFAWLADRPGTLVINWEGREVQTTVFHAIVLLGIVLVAAVVIWSILRGVWQLPAGVGSFFNRRREKRGLEALSSGLVAIGSGDKSLATRYAVQARKSLPNEPLTHILRAQAAQFSGDRATARRIFEAMLASPDTEPLGLRGLFLEAEREGETEAARQFAERALRLNPKVPWPIHALFDLQCKDRDWDAAVETLAVARKNGHIEKAPADRKRAVLLTAQAQAREESDPENAMKLAEEAHGLAPDLIPAAAIAGRLVAARGSVQKATKILQKSWRKGPHPDVAMAYAYARTGDSPRDRLTRVQQLAALSPHSVESHIAVAEAAIDARDFSAARDALEPLVDTDRQTQRVCTTMARIEGEDAGGNAGAVREWLARAVNAPRDAAWVADGVVADEWAPVSPVTGDLDAFSWTVPADTATSRGDAILHEKIEELVALGAPSAATVAAASAFGGSPNARSTDAEDATPVVDITPVSTTTRSVDAPAPAPSVDVLDATDATPPKPAHMNGSHPASTVASSQSSPEAAEPDANQRKYDEAREKAARQRVVASTTAPVVSSAAAPGVPTSTTAAASVAAAAARKAASAVQSNTTKSPSSAESNDKRDADSFIKAD
ncbi:MAG: heme biosynthesis HemY N-terminal domain-containing protein [Pseudomonadota bacterium]